MLFPWLLHREEGEQAKDKFMCMLMHYPIDYKAYLVAALEDKVAIFLFSTLEDDG